MTQTTKQFQIGDVLSAMTGHLVSLDGTVGLFAILDWMTGETLMHHQLGRAMQAASPVLEGLYPQLAAIKYPLYLDKSEDARFTWIETQGELFGIWWEVPRLDTDIYEPMDPGDEIVEGFDPETMYW
jgi:hypothetical protein